MDRFVEKFNIFDLFTMLIPGIIISALFGISLSPEYIDTWNTWGAEKYICFFIFSYLCGITYQELGTIADSLFLYKLLYGGNPKELFLEKDGYKKILKDKLLYRDAVLIEKYFKKVLNIDYEKVLDLENEGKRKAARKINSEIFAHCLSLSEKENITYKSDKMSVISEMSRSLFWGFITTILLNIFMIVRHRICIQFYLIEIIFLFILSIIFLKRKVRYEKYRIHILLRTFLLHILLQQNKKK